MCKTSENERCLKAFARCLSCVQGPGRFVFAHEKLKANDPVATAQSSSAIEFVEKSLAPLTNCSHGADRRVMDESVSAPSVQAAR